jgi:23S rRNA (guanine2535-N1)-methyltransferase
MTYRFALDHVDFTDLATGRVFQGLPGHPAFPVRLATEIFQRCAALADAAPYTIYDPCCGGAYLLSVIGMLHRDQIAYLCGSDIDPDALSLAERNLSLLTREGLTHRIAQIQDLLERYGKPSHAEALQSAERLRSLAGSIDLPSRVFRADATSTSQITTELRDQRIDLVITDLPYGSQSAWQTAEQTQPPSWLLLDVLRSVIARDSVVAICANKQQKIAHEAYRRVEHFQIGKRRIVILKLL